MMTSDLDTSLTATDSCSTGSCGGTGSDQSFAVRNVVSLSNDILEAISESKTCNSTKSARRSVGITAHCIIYSNIQHFILSTAVTMLRSTLNRLTFSGSLSYVYTITNMNTL